MPLARHHFTGKMRNGGLEADEYTHSWMEGARSQLFFPESACLGTSGSPLFLLSATLCSGLSSILSRLTSEAAHSLAGLLTSKLVPLQFLLPSGLERSLSRIGSLSVRGPLWLPPSLMTDRTSASPVAPPSCQPWLQCRGHSGDPCSSLVCVLSFNLSSAS